MERKKQTNKKGNGIENDVVNQIKLNFSLDDCEKRNALIVGASSGIGYETAVKLIGKDYNVVNFSRTACSLKQVVNVAVDVSVDNQLENAIKQIGEILKNVDVLIYSAGFSMAAPVEIAQSKDYRYLFEVNYFGALRTIQSVLPYMKNKGGKIILVSSIGGVLPIPFDSFYSSSKAALNVLAKSLNSELFEYDIKTTAVMPGGTATAFTFKRKVYDSEQCGNYASIVEQSVRSLSEMEQGGMSAGEVAKVIVNCIENKNPPITVSCGAMNKLYNAMQRILPEKLSLYFNENKYFN